MGTLEEEIRQIETLPDGTSVYEVGSAPVELKQDVGFYDNLAGTEISDTILKKISTYLLEAIEEDIAARADWLEGINKIKGYLGFSPEDLEKPPFARATRTYDTTLSTAFIRAYSIVRAEFLPETAPVGISMMGNSSTEKEEKATRKREWYNYYLTKVDKSYYRDFEKCFFETLFGGSGFKKVFFDDNLKRPIARFVKIEDLIVNADCTSILDSTRITHVLHLTKSEIINNLESGYYRDVDLPYLKKGATTSNDENETDTSQKKIDDVDKTVYSNQSLFSFYEVNVLISLDDFHDNNLENKTENTLLPYVITIDVTTKQIVRLTRHWEENDPKKERINNIIQYNYLPGFGIYGLGLAQLAGTNAISLTSIVRMILDAAKFQNLQGGLRVKGMGPQENDMIIAPGEWKEVNTAGMALSDCFMKLPYDGPSGALMQIRLDIINQTKELTSTSELGMMDSKEDISSTTAMAFLEANNRIQSAVMKSLHYSFTQELQLLDKFFRKTMGDDFYEEFHDTYIQYQDLDETIELIPVSDPSTNSTVQRIYKANALLQVAMQAPELNNMREVFKIQYQAHGLSEKEIEKILLPDPAEMVEEVLPLDPGSENINMLLGKPVKVAKWQEDDAHILIHGLFVETQPDDPDLQARVMAHIKEHQANKLLKEMEQALGMTLPPLEELMNPEIQNEIALALANSVGNSETENNQAAPPPDPNAVWLADIEAKKEENETRERIARLKAETDAFKAQLDFEKEKAKIESNEDIAILKSETELQKQENANI
jgi:hypothetical protein